MNPETHEEGEIDSPIDVVPVEEEDAAMDGITTDSIPMIPTEVPIATTMPPLMGVSSRVDGIHAAPVI